MEQTLVAISNDHCRRSFVVRLFPNVNVRPEVFVDLQNVLLVQHWNPTFVPVKPLLLVKRRVAAWAEISVEAERVGAVRRHEFPSKKRG